MPSIKERFDEIFRQHEFGQRLEAKVLFRELINDLQTADTPENLGYRGAAKGFMRDWKGSEEDLVAAFRQNEDDMFVLSYLAALKKILQRYDEAIEFFDNVLEQQPENIFARSRRGISLLAKGKYELALLDFNQTLVLEPIYPLVLVNKAETLRMLGYYHEAKLTLEKIPNTAYRTTFYYFVLAKILYHYQKHAEAQLNIQFGLSLTPNHLVLKKLEREFADRSLDSVQYWQPFQIKVDNLTYRGHINGSNFLGQLQLESGDTVPVMIKKFLIPHIACHALIKFYQEALFGCKLKHANIIKFLGYQDEQPFSLVFEQCQAPLDHLLTNPNVEFQQKLQWAIQIANGLNYLHTFNPVIVHKNLSTNTVLVGLDEQCKITNFEKAVTIKKSKDICSIFFQFFKAKTYPTAVDIMAYGVILHALFCNEIKPLSSPIYSTQRAIFTLMGKINECVEIGSLTQLPKAEEMSNTLQQLRVS